MNPQQIKIMLDLQDSMNTKVNANWQTQGYEWYRAIWVECAELLDHYGWKWWKKQTPDTEQVALELIDIWHFGLSILLQSGTKPELIVAQIQHSDKVSNSSCILSAAAKLIVNLIGGNNTKTIIICFKMKVAETFCFINK